MELNDHSWLYVLESLNTIFMLVCKIKGNDGGRFNRIDDWGNGKGERVCGSNESIKKYLPMLYYFGQKQS